MGNDKQIKVKETGSILEQAKAAFLPQMFKDPEAKPHQYDLENEYERSKKNKPYFLYVFVAAFIALILISSIIIIVVIQNKSRKIELNIRDFEDVKIKELIDSSKKSETEIDQLRRDLTEIDNNYNDKIDRIGQEFDRLSVSLSMSEISDGERAAKLKAAEAERDAKLKKAGDGYNADRKVKTSQIAAKQRRINEGGSAAVSAKKSYGNIFGGENRLFKMQIDKVSNEYEDRLRKDKEQTRKDKEDLVLLYNPVFKEKFVLEVLQKPAPAAQSRSDYFAGIADDLALEKAITGDQLKKLNDDMKGELAITGRLRQIPYRNSVQRAVVQSDSLTKSIFNTYDMILQKLAVSMRGKNLSLKYYNYALDYMTKSQQENGYILDARDSAAIGVYYNKVHKVRSGDLAFVFRSDDDYIATIRFISYNGIIVGELVEKAPGRDIRPFDKIMFKMEREQK
ncbi:MAG: hypothetical protein ACRCUT_14225 [Spirochaetota bacterium]